MDDAAPSLADLLDLDYGAFSQDLSFYQNLARHCDGPLLELGAGTGRAAIPLARAGFEVCGIDRDEALLARARCKAGPALERLQLRQADMRDFDLGRRFALVFAGFGAFHHLLTPDDQRACLRCVGRHLEPGGLFVCDLRPWHQTDWESAHSVPLLHDWTRPVPKTGETVMKFRSVRAEPARQLQHETHLYEIARADGSVRRVSVTVDLRFTTQYEMEALLREAGLELEQRYGDFDLGPYDDDSPYMITVARKPAAEESPA